MNKNIFITGGIGFIGINVAKFYLKNNYNVKIYDCLFRPGVEQNLEILKQENHSNLTVLQKDVRDFPTLKEEIKESDIVLHFAGQTAVTTSVTDPRTDFEVNALGTFNVCEAVRQSCPKATLGYSSTNKVYGAIPSATVKEEEKRYVSTNFENGFPESLPLDFYSPYGCSKGTGDQYIRDYHRIYNLNSFVFRQSCIYGTYQLGVEDQGWLAHFILMAINNKTLSIYGDGKQVRDVLFIDDLVEAYDKAINNIDRIKGEIFNIGGGPTNTISLLELIEEIEKLNNQKIDLKFADWRPGDQKIYISDVSKAKQVLGWEPKTNTTNGIKKLFDWLKYKRI
jgi:CDP-paratose 2-epimerase